MIQDKNLLSIYGLCALLLILGVIVSLLGVPFGTGDIIIRFDNYHNEVVWSGGTPIFFGVIGIAFVILGLNFWLSRYIYENEKFLSYVLAAGTLIFSFFFLIATFSISLIN